MEAAGVNPTPQEGAGKGYQAPWSGLTSHERYCIIDANATPLNLFAELHPGF
jgi:hypothetical protein